MTLTAKEQAMFDRFIEQNHIQYWFSDEARKVALGKDAKGLWSFDNCMSRLNDLKKRTEESGDCELVVQFFANLRAYERKGNDQRLPSPAYDVARQEENAHRIYKLWLKHFDAWYTEFQANQEDQENEYAF